MSARDAVELAARDSYGRIVAWLVSRCGDFALAEDCLADALEAALRQWPDGGVPDNPESWLLTVARRRLIDRRRRRGTRLTHEQDVRDRALERLQRDAMEAGDVPFREALPDRRLELMFLCAHPEIPREMRAPLMLQVVLGVSAERIAGLVFVAPSTLGQRLVRLKRKLADAALPFEVPAAELDERLHDVLEAIYGAYGASSHDESFSHGLAGEAFWLAQLLVRLRPEEPEVLGLYSLLCHIEARRPARRSEEGEFVPLQEQDVARWNAALIAEGEAALRKASSASSPGPFQLEAAIQSLHADRRRTGTVDWERVSAMYAILVQRHPSTGARIGLAASLGRIDRWADGLAVLDAIDPSLVERHQPYWAVRAWLLRRAGREAGDAYDLAIGLAGDPALRTWLIRQRATGV